MPGRSRWLKVAASVALALLLLGVFAWQARERLPEVGAALASLDAGWVLLAVLAGLLSYLLRALRWAVILRPLGRPRLGDVIGSTAAGFAASTLLPARAGEVVRPLLLSARSGLPASGTLASILTERLVDLASVLALFGAGVAAAGRGLQPGALAPLRDAALLAGAGLAVAAGVVVVLLRRRDTAVDRLARLAPARFRSRASSFLHHVLDGLEAVRTPAGLVRLSLWSLATWVAASLQSVALARAFGFELSLAQSFILLAVSVIGLAVPTPGGLGGFHAFVQLGLSMVLSVDIATATAFALVHHAIAFVPITLLGLVYMSAVGASLSALRKPAAPAGEA